MRNALSCGGIVLQPKQTVSQQAWKRRYKLILQRNPMQILRVAMCLILFTSFAQAKPHHSYKNCFLPLCPTRQSLYLQNEAIDQQGLERIRDSKELQRLVLAGNLVAPVTSSAMVIAHSLPVNRRYVLPQVNSFLGQLSGEFYEQFRKPLVLTSAIRPVVVQRNLRRYNKGAAPAEGELASSHEAGCTVDLGRAGLTRAQTRFLEWRLTYYQAIGWVIVEQEKRCYHVMVIKTFVK